MNKSANPIVLFIGGVILGVLIAMGFIMRANNSGAAGATIHPPVQLPDVLSGSILPSVTTSYGHNSPVENTPSTIAPAPVQAISSPVPPPSTPQSPPQLPLATVQAPGTTNEPLAQKARPRWAPGKPGAFADAEERPATPVDAVVPATIESGPPANQQQQTTDIAATGLTRKQQKQAALLLKRQQQKQQLNSPGDGGTVKSIGVPGTTAVASAPTTAVPAQSSATSPAATGRTGQATSTSTATALPAHALPSSYSVPKIAQAMAMYHGQALRDNSKGVVPHIPSYSAAAAAR